MPRVIWTPGYNGTATLTLPRTAARSTVPITNGVAVFDGLTLTQAESGATFTISTTLPEGPVSVTTNPVAVTAPTPGVGNYYPLPLDSSSRGDIRAANNNADALNYVWLVYDTNYPLTNGQIVIDNGNSSVPTKTLDVIGTASSGLAGASGDRAATASVTGSSTSYSTRIFLAACSAISG